MTAATLVRDFLLDQPEIQKIAKNRVYWWEWQTGQK